MTEKSHPAETATAQVGGKLSMHFKLDEDILQMKALLDTYGTLHHYAQLTEGHALSDSTLAGLLQLHHRVVHETDAHLQALFDEIRTLKLT